MTTTSTRSFFLFFFCFFSSYSVLIIIINHLCGLWQRGRSIQFYHHLPSLYLFFSILLSIFMLFASATRFTYIRNRRWSYFVFDSPRKRFHNIHKNRELQEFSNVKNMRTNKYLATIQIKKSFNYTHKSKIKLNDSLDRKQYSFHLTKTEE
jgi:hypothetical protein